MLHLFKRKTLREVLHETKDVKIKGVKFKIKKIDPLDHAKGLKVMLAQFDKYNVSEKKNIEASEKKAREHYRHVFLAGVVTPKLSVKDEEDATCVDDLFLDVDLAEKLYTEIMILTYGKKKLKLKEYQNTGP